MSDDITGVCPALKRFLVHVRKGCVDNVRYLLSDDIAGVGPALKRLLVHVVSIEIASLVRVWVDMLIVIVFASRHNCLLEQSGARRSPYSRTNLFQIC